MLAGNSVVCIFPPLPCVFLLSDLSKRVTFLPCDWGFLRIRAVRPPSAHLQLSLGPGNGGTGCCQE